MGDNKRYTIQVKGTAYRFQPIKNEDYERVALVKSLSADGTKLIKAVTRVLANSAGPEAWDELTDRYIDGEITLKELTVDVFEKLVKRQGADERGRAKAKADRGTLDAASTELVPADDAE